MVWAAFFCSRVKGLKEFRKLQKPIEIVAILNYSRPRHTYISIKGLPIESRQMALEHVRLASISLGIYQC